MNSIDISEAKCESGRYSTALIASSATAMLTTTIRRMRRRPPGAAGLYSNFGGDCGIALHLTAARHHQRRIESQQAWRKISGSRWSVPLSHVLVGEGWG